MAGKRAARHQITKDGTSRDDGSSSSSEEVYPGAGIKPIPVAQRQISKPVSLLSRLTPQNESAGSFNPFAGLKTTVISSHPSTLSSSNNISSTTAQQSRPSIQSTVDKDNLNPPERDALKNLGALNQSFQRAVSDSLRLDPLIDFSSLFDQYRRHRAALEVRFDEARNHRGGPIDLGFVEEKKVVVPASLLAVSHPPRSVQSSSQVKQSTGVEQIRPVSVDLPAFAVQPKPPTPVLVTDAPKPPLFAVPSMTTASTVKETRDKEKDRKDREIEVKQFTLNTDPQGFTFNAQQPSAFTLGASESKFAVRQEEMEERKAFTFGSTESKFSFPPTEPGKFSFPSVPSLPAFGAPSGSTIPQFSFAQSSVANEEEDGSDNGIPEGEEESFGGERSNTEMIKRGEGEEGETEIYAPTRCKLYLFDTETKGWGDLGVAIAKINMSSDNKSRIVCRAEGSGKVLLNAYLPRGAAQYTEGRREVSLTVMRAGKPARFLVRMKESDQARALLDAITAHANL